MPPPQEAQYLHPDFDPWKIKMDQIRDILIQHHVKTPTGIVKKQQLVDLFIQHIRPKVPKLEESDSDDKTPKPASSSKARHHHAQEQEKTKSDSIKQEQKDKTKQESAPVRPARLRRASSKARMASEDALDEPAVKPKLKRSNSRAKTPSDKTDTELKPSEPPRGRKPRRPTLQSDDDDSEPVVKPIRVKRESKAKSNFSDENPFQSGSESERKRSRSRSRTRKTKDTDKSATRDHVFKVPAQPAFSKFMHDPVSNKGESSKSSSHSKLRTVSLSDVPPPKPLHSEPAQSDLQNFLRNFRRHLGPFWLILSTVLLAYGIWYRQTTFDIGFCTEVDTKTPTSRPWFYPSCIPCPDHATCLRSDADPICHPEYLLKPQLLSFGNLLPLTPVCILDRTKEYQSLQVADAVEKLLQLHAGSVECSFSREKAPKDSLEYRVRRGMSLNELKDQLKELKDTNVSEEDFGHYWDRALKELGRRKSVIFEEGVQSEERIRSLKPRKSLSCQVRQALLGWIVKFRLFLFAVVASIAGGFAVRAHIQKRRKQSRIINGLVQNVLTKLADQAHYHYVDPLSYPDPFLPQLHLRDALLPDIHSNVRRQEIWEKVEQIVDRNANVRVSSQEVRGEPYRVWEWVGPSGVLKGQRGSSNNSEATGSSSAASGSSHHLHQGGIGNSILHGARGVPKVPPRTGPHGSFFGIRRQDSEYLNPGNSLYSSPSQDEYQTHTDH
ncbi:Man1-Src1p-C-terminal domain-containing protein [Mortierella sp. GBAus27b]|nr:Man1-Src1p-C-terminal domain-containing protein [Mortierella sp. GBAus27b]